MNPTLNTRHFLLAVLLLSFGLLLASQYFSYPLIKEYTDIVFGITALAIVLVVYIFIKEINRAARLHTELYLREVQLRETLNSLEEGVITTDSRGIIQSMNPSAEILTGWKNNEAKQQSLEKIYNVVNEETGKHFQSIVSRILNEGKTIEFENNTILQKKTGEEIIISNSGSPIINTKGEIMGAVLVFRDITFKKEAEEQLHQFRHFFNNSHDLICIANISGYFELLNPNFEKVLGYSTNELQATPFINFIHQEDVASTMQEVEKLTTGALTINFTNRYRKKDGSYIWLEWNANPDPKAGKLYCVARDITERIKVEMAIERLNENLEIKVAERTAQLEESNKELEAFSYSVSHDLRAPLRAVGSYAQMLEEDYSATLDQEGKRLLKIISKSAEKMGTLIDDLLAFSRLGKQELQKTKVDMSEITTGVLAELNLAYPNKAEITIDKLPKVICDSSLITHVLSNLLSNAIKYSSRKDKPQIELTTKHEAQDVIFCIRDNGAGFDMRYAHKLFGVFQRLHLEKDYEGTGVGLAIANRIVTKHGGRMWAESILGNGAAFYFTLPSLTN